MWDYSKQEVYNVAAPAFDEEANPSWWRFSAANLKEEDEPLLFPEFPPPPATSSARVSKIVDSSPDDDIPADDASMMPPDQPAPALASTATSVPDICEAC